MMNNKDLIFKELENEIKIADLQSVEWISQYFFDHKKRYESNLKIIDQYYESGDILEIGSFPYHLTFCLEKLGYPITGLDLAPDRWGAFIKKHDLSIIKCDIEREKIPFDDRRFKFIIFNEIFEHLRINPISSLKELNRVLKPNGILILSTPNLYSISNIVKFILGKGGPSDPYKQFEKLYTKGHMGHIREYSTKEVKKFLENTGFEIVKVFYKFYGGEKVNKEKKVISTLEKIVGSVNFIHKLHPFQVIVSKKLDL